MGDVQKTYDSVIAARYLLAVAFSKGKILNVTKVQKLLYIAYGYFLAKKRRVLLDEKPRAWPYGPVFPKTREEVDYENVIPLDSDEFQDIKQDEAIKHFFDYLIDEYAKYTASQLSDWSHSEGSPWDRTTRQTNFKWNRAIPDEYISAYFSTFSF